MVATTNSRAVTGGAFQMTKEAIADNRYAADWLKERGFAAPIVIGHSNGGMLAVQHVADHPADARAGAALGPSRRQVESCRSPARSACSAATASTRSRRQARAHGGAGPRRRADGAARLVARDHGGELSRLLLGASRRAGARPRITCPVLYIRGDKEPAHIYPAEEFAARAGGRCDVRIVKDCDHFYGGREDAVAGHRHRLARRGAGENLNSHSARADAA